MVPCLGWATLTVCRVPWYSKYQVHFRRSTHPDVSGWLWLFFLLVRASVLVRENTCMVHQEYQVQYASADAETAACWWSAVVLKKQ